MPDHPGPDTFRHEMKYICSQGQLAILEHRLNHVLRPDAHAGPTGVYHIRSVYFDDPYGSCVQENLAGVNHREKWRIRAYNRDPSRLSLERKVKENDRIHKDSCRISQAQFALLMAGRPCPVSDTSPDLLNRFSLLIATRHFAPKVIVGYDRRPYIYPAGNVRITFDSHIWSSSALDRFFDRELPRRPVQITGQHLLEVKFDAFLPDWIRQAIQMEGMQRTAFSKFYLCRTYPAGIAQPGFQTLLRNEAEASHV